MGTFLELKLLLLAKIKASMDVNFFKYDYSQMESKMFFLQNLNCNCFKLKLFHLSKSLEMI